MDATLRNTPALLVRINHLSEQLVKKYLDIVRLAELPTSHAPASDSDSEDDDDDDTSAKKGPPNRNQAAVNSVTMEVEVGTLIKTAEDLLTLTRQMKESWLFGQLNTLGEDAAVEKAERDVQGVVDVLERLDGAGNAKTGAV
ncbi:MAG: hypothetical protein M1831_002151 [Alyxoria varia]|nr:MAG: hypothetical protein M1831_002151 [Alyxoria varia]